MKKILAFVLLLVTASCGALAPAASYRATDGANYAVITDTACANAAVLAHIAAEAQPLFRAARVVIGGKQYAACWRHRNDAVLLIYDDGDAGLLPKSVFRQETEI